MAEQQKEFELPFPEAKIYTYYASEKPVFGNYPIGGDLSVESFEEKKMVARPKDATSSTCKRCADCFMKDACWNVGMGKVKIK